MSVYLCQKCNKWFKTKVEWKSHKCAGKGNPNPAYFEKPKETENVPGIMNSPEDASNDTLVALNRVDLIAELKEKELIKDARSVKGKTDEELSEMLETGE